MKKLSSTEMKFLSLIETLTQTKLLDCFMYDGTLYVIVEKENVAKLIGKSGSIVKRIRKICKMPIRIVADGSTKQEIIANFGKRLKKDFLRFLQKRYT